MSALHFDPADRLRAEPWVTDAEMDILADLRCAEAGFWNLPEDKAGERAAFRAHIAALEELVVKRFARRTADTPLLADEDETERHLRGIAEADRRERLEAHVTAWAIIGIAIFGVLGAVIATALRFQGVGA